MKVLFLSRWFPYPPDNGSRNRVFNLLKQLAQAHDVVLVSFAEGSDLDRQAHARRVLSPYCSDVVTVPYRDFQPSSRRALAGFVSPQPRSVVDTHSESMLAAVRGAAERRSPELVVASQLGMAPYALALPGVPRLLEELELSAFSDAPHLAQRLRRRITWLKLASYLRWILPQFAACTVVSEVERSNVRRAVPRYTRVRLIPNALEPARYAQSYGPPRPNSLVYAGALTYHANLDAVRYWLESIYPQVVRAAPDVKLHVTGRTERVDVERLPPLRGVTLTGYLPDVRSLVATSWASIVPVRLGGGTRFKILESMALGTPVVSTPKGAEGLGVTDGQHILLAETPRELAQHVVELLGSAELRARLADAGKRVVAAHYDWSVVGRELRGLVNEVGGRAA